MGRARASVGIEGVQTSEAEALWYDPHRWPVFVDGFGHISRIDDSWPDEGAQTVWDSNPGGRGRVIETVVAYEARVGQTLGVEDERVRGTQRVAFTPHPEGVRVALELEYKLKSAGPLAPLVDFFFIRRAQADSLRRTLARLRAELEALRDEPAA